MSLSINPDQIKSASDAEIRRFLNKTTSNPDILYVLKNLGKLPADFDGTIFTRYLSHSNGDIRFWAVKNIGKLGSSTFAEDLFQIACHDEDSMVRREAVSSLGRMRDENLIRHFIYLLSDPDAKVVLQAVRALLVFKQKAEVVEALRYLENHENEQIQLVLRHEFSEADDVTDYGSQTTTPDFMKNMAVLGDVRQVLQVVPDGAVHLTFTSPPYYNARDYSIYSSYEGYLDFLSDVFEAVHRITKEGRFLIVNTSPIIIPRISRAYSSKRYPIPFDLHVRLVNIGWEFIDDIVWAKPETSVKNRNAGFLQHRKPLGYKPNPVTEYLMVYRKETTKLLDWNMKQYDEDVIEASKVVDDYETSNLWQIQPRSDKVHSAIFPVELCQRVIAYYSYVGDLVFDPFGGVGTVGAAATELDRRFFLTEIVPEYFEQIQLNLQSATTRFVTLDEFKTSIQRIDI